MKRVPEKWKKYVIQPKYYARVLLVNDVPAGAKVWRSPPNAQSNELILYAAAINTGAVSVNEYDLITIAAPVLHDSTPVVAMFELEDDVIGAVSTPA